MERAETRLLGADELGSMLDQLAKQILKHRISGVPLRLIGIRTRGVPIAQRLSTMLEGDVPVGAR